jgi:type I restriction enzyme S subunit
MKIDYIENTKDYITSKAVKNSTAKLIPSKSLLFVVRSGILRHTLPIAINKVECTINQDLKALVPSKYIAPKYLLQLSSAYNKDLLNSCSKDGTTVQSIETSLLYNYPIPLPPLKEQEMIAGETEKLLSLIEKTEKMLDSELKRSKSLRQSILKKAFEGKLVPQDQNDEPASVLLERIKAEKSN